MKQSTSLKTRLAMCFAIALAVMCGTVYVFHRGVILTKFADIEHREAVTNVERAINAIAVEADRLRATSIDYADWDATRSFMSEQSEVYVTENLTSTNVGSLRINIMGIAKPDGTVLRGTANDEENEESAALYEEMLGKLAVTDTLKQIGIGAKKTDIILTTHGPMLIVSTHVPTSLKAPESMGTLFIGRLLTDEVVGTFARLSAVQMTLVPAAASHQLAMTGDSVVIHTTPEFGSDPQRILGNTTILDARGRSVLTMNVSTPRFVYGVGLETARATSVILVVGCAASLALLLWLTNRLIIRPIHRLSDHLVRVGETGDLSLTPPMIGRRDEIGRLAGESERMMLQLRDSQRRLADASRAAGAAQVATGALHNIGNILNGITTASSLLSSHLKTSKSARLPQAVEMLRAHESDLTTFLREDPKGQKLLPYLDELSGQLAGEIRRSTELSNRIDEDTNHAIEIVRRQQSDAGTINIKETLLASEVITHAMKIMKPSFERHGIAFTVDVPSEVRFESDRNKLDQILVNMLTNAKQACCENSANDRRIHLSAKRIGASVLFEVSDNGIGIAPEVLPRLFGQGFTTRPDGNGIGLHFCALTAKELGGSVSVKSAGVHQGATFSIEVPMVFTQLAKAA